VTVKFKGLAVLAFNPVRVSALDPPGGIAEGLKVQEAPVLQPKVMAPWRVLGAAAEIVKLAVLEPIRITLDRALEESENTGLPVPASWSAALVVTALDAIATLPVTFPVLMGLKLTKMVQVWPTFRVAGTVGKLLPQVLVCAKPDPTVMLVIVTG
jgi:hypothetical protein